MAGQPLEAAAEGMLGACCFDQELHDTFGRSLETFNPEQLIDGTPLLTSPRSLEACLRLGVLPDELRIR
jgi:hypothetical protein